MGLSVRFSCKMVSVLNVTGLKLTVFQVSHLGRAHVISWRHLAACDSDTHPSRPKTSWFFSVNEKSGDGQSRVWCLSSVI